MQCDTPMHFISLKYFNRVLRIILFLHRLTNILSAPPIQDSAKMDSEVGYKLHPNRGMTVKILSNLKEL